MHRKSSVWKTGELKGRIERKRGCNKKREKGIETERREREEGERRARGDRTKRLQY